jgi:hypothetical protein
MSNGGFLISPRVRVLWGKINLSAYDGTKQGAPAFPEGAPLVYDASVDIQAEGNGPTATMKWDPTGPGYAVYEWFLSKPEYMGTQITIEFFYPGKKKVTFAFVWSGQSISYGNDMAVNIKMVSELAGLINANPRSTAQAYDEKKGEAALNVYKKFQKQFGLEKFDYLVQFNQNSLAYSKKAKIENAYGSEITFGTAIGNMAKQTGDAAMGINIVNGPVQQAAKVVIFPPFSYTPKGGKQETVINAATLGPNSVIDVTKRYGYILGPSIINSLTRTSEWKPPQQDQNKTPGKQAFARDARGRFTSPNPPTAPQAAAANPSGAAASTSSPQGVANASSNPGIRNADNPEGPDRQNALSDEKVATLSVDTLMCPLLVGIKPYDIVYVPSLSGNFIEDWIVQSVDYSQNNGDVSVSIQATRLYGWGDAMNKSAADSFKTFAQTQGLIGPNASLEAWDRYAWGVPTRANASSAA